jgi:methylmalonyl-CoA/ethylmalonyl-CoA epimerase
MSTVGISRIGQIAITTHDLPRAVAFYRDVLELPFLFEYPGLAFFEVNGVRLMLSSPEQPEFDHPASPIYYFVPDIQTAHKALLDRGVSFVADPHLIARLPDREVWMAFFRDPDENTLAITSEVPIS